MKWIFVFLLLNCLAIHFSFAQLNAGDIPAGKISTNPNINLSVSIFTSDSASFDIDCDGMEDLRVKIKMGWSGIDASSSVQLFVLNSSIEICADSTPYRLVNYYKKGDALNCSGRFKWSYNKIHLLGYEYNGPCGLGQCLLQVTDEYIAYKKTGNPNIGWIKISFHLYETSNTSSLSITEVLSYCNATAVNEQIQNAFFQVHPNPTLNGTIQIKTTAILRKLELINSMGQIVYVKEGNTSELILPETKGIYLLRVFWEENKISQYKVLHK